MDSDLILQIRATLRRVQAREGLDNDGFKLLLRIETLAAKIGRGEDG